MKVSELFIRLNTIETDNRWSHLGHLVMLEEVGSVVAKQNLANKDCDRGSRMQRAAAHAVNHLQWKMALRELRGRRLPRAAARACTSLSDRLRACSQEQRSAAALKQSL